MKRAMRFVCLTLTVAVGGHFVQSAQADSTNWNNNIGGSFTDATKWTNGVPMSDDTAVFNRNLNIQYNVTFPGRPILSPLTREVRQLIVGTNTVSFADSLTFEQLPAALSVDALNTLGEDAIIIGESAGQVAVLNTTLRNFSTSGATIGKAVGSKGTLNVNAGTLSLTNDQVVKVYYVGYEGTGALNVNNGAAVNGNAFVELAAALSSNGTLTVSGPGSTFTGYQIIVGEYGTGTLTIQNGGAVSSVAAFLGYNYGSSGTVTVTGAGSTLTNESVYVGVGGLGELNITNGGHVSGILGQIGHSFGVSFGVAGAATIDGAGSTWTNSHGLTIVSGTLIVSNGGTVSSESVPLLVAGDGTVKGNGNISGDVVNVGVVAPGTSAGALHVDGIYTQDNIGRLQIELGGTTPGTDYDQLLVNGPVSLDGTLEVLFVDPYLPAAGDAFNILDWTGSPTGTFSSLHLPALYGGLAWNIDELYFSGTLSIGGVLGDYNGNGVVDEPDYTVWRDALGQSGSGLAADGDGDKMVDADDYDIWTMHFGESAPGSGSGANANAAVPEPVTLVMLLVGMLAMCAHRRAVVS